MVRKGALYGISPTVHLSTQTGRSSPGTPQTTAFDNAVHVRTFELEMLELEPGDATA